MLAPSSQHERLVALQKSLLEWKSDPHPRFSSGLDCLFPGGFCRGTLIEYLADGGSGAVSVALLTAREASSEGRPLIVIDRLGRFYPPALANWGFDLTKTIFVRPQSKQEETWAFHQSLHCQGIGAVLCWPEKLDSRAFRSLQLAAESGEAVGLLIRPAEVRGHPTWSEVQLLVEACPGEKARRIRVEVVRCRIGKPGSVAIVELDDETGILQTARVVPVAAELATATTACGATGA
jgi:hypothetical protein